MKRSLETRINLALSQKGFEGIISRKINRKISVPIAKSLYDRSQNINPDRLTLISTGIGLGGATLFFLSNGVPLYAILGGVLIQLSSIADGIDGDYARYLTQRSRAKKSFGEYLDTLTDRIVDIAIIYGIGTYLSNVFDSWWVLPLTFAAFCLSLLASYTRQQIIKISSLYRFNLFSDKIDLAGRDIRLFAFFMGGLFEGLSYLNPIMKGLPLAISMAFVSFSHLSQIFVRSLRLKRNLDKVEE